jgi:AcrR family transcriptional regulator
VADERNSKQQQRAARILDAAAELVLRWGYKRVTIEEVAKRADIGKGTVYLHYKTREALFIAVLARESAMLFDMFTAAMQKDPAEILLSRVMRRTVLSMKDRPLVQAVFSRDTEVLGELATDRSARPLQGQKFAFTREYYDLLRSRGLLRADLPPDAQFYAINATVFGFYLLDPLLPPEERRPLEERAELIATTLRDAFEPRDPPDPAVLRELAPEVIGRLEKLRADYIRFAQGNSTSTSGKPEE